jgi:hypothetical protein
MPVRIIRPSILMPYTGITVFDAGLFYCPYIPLQMSREFAPLPKIKFRTRYT